jgi:hypothetical protein
MTSGIEHGPNPWRLERPDYNPDDRAQELRARFAKITKARIPHRRWFGWWKALAKALLVGSLIGIVGAGLLMSSPWPPLATIQHLASAPNCDAARAVGVAPARVGQPGYWKRHDRDDDGIACEVYHGRRYR